MITPPTAPATGKPVSASFFARLIRWVKSGQLIDGVGYRLRRTPNGTSIEFVNTEVVRNTAPVQEFAWTFSVSEDQETGELKGGWRNKVLQDGYNPINLDDYEDDDEDMTTFDDTGHVDGKYYLEIDLKEYSNTERFKIKVVTEPGKEIPYHDIENSIVRVRIGEVTDGKQSGRIIMAPVVYTYIQS